MKTKTTPHNKSKQVARKNPKESALRVNKSKGRSSASQQAGLQESPRVSGYIAVISILLLVFIDRLTKAWASSIPEQKHFYFITFTYVTNTGAGFSILQNMNPLLIIVSVIVLAALLYYRRQINTLSLLLLVSGILGNLIDRVMLGHVIDFVDLGFWPIFNLSDAMICIGVAYWIIILLVHDMYKPAYKKYIRPGKKSLSRIAK